MNTELTLEIDRAEGSLLRLIGLIERRGFHIEKLELQGSAGAARGVRLEVRPAFGERCADNLRRQIDKLYGVRAVPVFAPDQEVTVWPAE